MSYTGGGAYDEMLSGAFPVVLESCQRLKAKKQNKTKKGTKYSYYVRQNNGPQRCPHPNAQNLCRTREYLCNLEEELLRYD